MPEENKTKLAEVRSGRSASCCSICWRFLEEDELPIAGDEGRVQDSLRWETVTIPHIWLAGGQRIKGVEFRRRKPKENE